MTVTTTKLTLFKQGQGAGGEAANEIGRAHV